MGLVYIYTAFRTDGVLLLPFAMMSMVADMVAKQWCVTATVKATLQITATMCNTHHATLGAQPVHPAVMSTTSHHWQGPLPRPVKPSCLLAAHLQAPLTHS
jgi:hypothetical protein